MESPFPEPVPDDTRLIETFGWWPEKGACRIGMHLARMARSAASLGFRFDEDEATRRVAALSGQAPLRCRLTIGRAGDVDLTTAQMGLAPTRPWRVALHPERLHAGNPWLQHKTTMRQLYDQSRAGLPEHLQEWLFVNNRGELCEGTITNVFVTLPDGRVVTPPLSCGLLPGILRQEMLEAGLVDESILTPDMLSGATIQLGNSLRGLIPAELQSSDM